MLELPGDGKGLRWIIDQGPSQLLLIPGLHPASIVAAAAGDAEALSFLHVTAQSHAASGSRSVTPLDEACAAASQATSFAKHEEVRSNMQGNPRVCQVYRTRRAHTLKLLHAAAKNGQLAALRWLQALCYHLQPVIAESDIMELMESAALGGQLNILKYLSSGPEPPPWPPTILALVAFHPDCLEWLLVQEPPCPYDENNLREVAAAGNLPALQYLRLHPEKFMPLTDWDESIICRAAEKGHLAVVQWLRSLPVPWDATCSSGAAYCGHLSVLQWIRGQTPACSWDWICTRNAAYTGRLEILQWLRKQTPPAPWNVRCTEAAAGHDISILEWLLTQDPPCPLHPNSWLPAVRCGDLPMLKLLSRHGCMPTGQAYYDAAWRNHVPVLRWLHRKQVPVCQPHSHAVPRGKSISSPVLLFLGDIHVPLPPSQQPKLAWARRTFCTFHGLLRWARRAVSDPSKGINSAFDAMSTDTAGQTLLVWLSLLPPEILNKIAVAAGLQHNLFEGLDNDTTSFAEQ